jgi:hypothetical protein
MRTPLSKRESYMKMAYLCGICLLLGVEPAAFAAPPLTSGHYTRVSPASGFPALDISSDAAKGSFVKMSAPIPAPAKGCTTPVILTLVYDLPFDYAGTAVSYATGSGIQGFFTCPGFVLHVNLPPQILATFKQANRDAVTATSQYWGGVATFSSANHQTIAKEPGLKPKFSGAQLKGSSRESVVTAIN